MTSFDRVLRHVEGSLEVPYPERRHVLDEIAAHLEALHRDLVAGGASDEQAYYTALDTLALDDSFLASMSDVHRPAVARVLEQLPRAVSLGIEYGLITLTGVAIFGAVIFQEAPVLQFILDGGFFMIPLNLAGLAIVILSIERLYSLFLKRDHSTHNLSKRLASLRFLGILTALTGVLGTLIGAYSAFSAAPEIMVRHGGVFPMYDVAAIAITTTIWGMSLTLLAEIAHFVVNAKASRIEQMRLQS